MASYLDGSGTFLLDVERLEFIEVAIGISAFGNSARHVFVLDGPSGTVKSTMTGALQHCLGEIATGIPTSVLCAAAASSGEGPAPYTASLHGRRFAFSQEATQKQVWNTGALKALTSGEMVPARGLYGNPFNFVNLADIWLTTNANRHNRHKGNGVSLGDAGPLCRRRARRTGPWTPREGRHDPPPAVPPPSCEEPDGPQSPSIGPPGLPIPPQN